MYQFDDFTRCRRLVLLVQGSGYSLVKLSTRSLHLWLVIKYLVHLG